MANNQEYWAGRQNQRIGGNITDMVNDFEIMESDMLTALAWEVNKNLKDSIQSGEKTGQIYKRGNITHQASAPGQSPASDTETLVKSISDPIKVSNEEYNIIIGEEYALYLETGTINMEARPFVQKSIDKAYKKYG